MIDRIGVTSHRTARRETSTPKAGGRTDGRTLSLSSFARFVSFVRSFACETDFDSWGPSIQRLRLFLLTINQLTVCADDDAASSWWKRHRSEGCGTPSRRPTTSDYDDVVRDGGGDVRDGGGARSGRRRVCGWRRREARTGAYAGSWWTHRCGFVGACGGASACNSRACAWKRVVDGESTPVALGRRRCGRPRDCGYRRFL